MNTSDAGKAMIMIFNIHDENYWDYSYPYYIVGYFSPDIRYYYDRNIIHIDCWTGRTERPELPRDHGYMKAPWRMSGNTYCTTLLTRMN